MGESLSLSRRGVVKTVGATALGASQSSGAVGATQNGAVTEDPTVSVDWDTDTVRYRFEYQIPDGRDEFTVRFPGLWLLDFRSVREGQNVEREAVSDEPDRFVWDGTDNPVIVLEDEVSNEQFVDIEAGYYTDNELFLFYLATSEFRLDKQGNREPYTLEGEGYINDDLLFAGPHEMDARTVDDTELAVVVPDSVTEDIDIQRTLDLLESWHDLLGGIDGTNRSTACVLVPEFRLNTAAHALGESFYVPDNWWELDSVDNTPSHEFAHTVFDTFDAEPMYWLNEAVAEYYGYLLSLGTGLADYDEFLETVRLTEAYQDTVLTDAVEMQNTEADYFKGAHVLAALDAEIRERTDGAQTLLSVFETAYDLSSYDRFKRTVAQIAADPSIEEWVDRYVDGPEIPEIPDTREYFAIRDRARIASVSPSVTTIEPGESVEITAEIEPIQVNSGTVSVEVYVGREQVTTRDVGIESGETATVTLTSDDLPEFEAGTHEIRLRVGAFVETANVTVVPQPEFHVNELALEETEVPADEPLAADIDIRNSGNDQGTAFLEVVLVGESEQILDSREVSVGSLETRTVSLEEIDLSDVEPGEYTLVARTEDSQQEQTLVIEESTGSTSTGDADGSGNDGSGPGFTIGSTLTGLGGLAYVLKRRLGPERTDEE